MHWFLFAFTLCLLEVGRGDLLEYLRAEEDATNVLASVRQYPSEIHKCSATFITQKTLLATARCVYCPDSCKFFVHALSSHLTDEGAKKGKNYQIKNIIIHPDFERDMNDISVIQLVQRVPKAKLFSLPDAYILTSHNTPAVIYNWKFSENKNSFYLHRKKVRIVSNGKCTLALNHFIDSFHVCAEVVRGSIQMGNMDQGTPLSIRKNGKDYFVGLYTREGLMRAQKTEVFQFVPPYVQWIQESMRGGGNQDSDESGGSKESGGSGGSKESGGSGGSKESGENGETTEEPNESGNLKESSKSRETHHSSKTYLIPFSRSNSRNGTQTFKVRNPKIQTSPLFKSQELGDLEESELL